MGFIKAYVMVACVVVLAACLLAGHSTSDDTQPAFNDWNTAVTADTMPPIDQPVKRGPMYMITEERQDDPAAVALNEYVNWRTLALVSLSWFAIFPFIGIGRDVKRAISRHRTRVKSAMEPTPEIILDPTEATQR